MKSITNSAIFNHKEDNNGQTISDKIMLTKEISATPAKEIASQENQDITANYISLGCKSPMEFMSPDFLRETFKNLKNQEIDIEKIESNYVIAKFDSENF